jgi:hypothetical protein
LHAIRYGGNKIKAARSDRPWSASVWGWLSNQHQQSPGQTRVQARCQSVHDYIPEKRAAVVVLMRVLCHCDFDDDAAEVASTSGFILNGTACNASGRGA